MNNIIFKAIVGSQSYGTSIPESDIDYKGVYLQSNDEILSSRYKDQYQVTKDECYYEVARFLQLLQTANPTVLELLYSPNECIVKSSPQFDLIVACRDKFLTKKCLQSFGGYASAQIKKARGLNKKMNYEHNRIERKSPLDFCWLYKNGLVYPFLETNLDSMKCGLSRLNHIVGCYSLFYDENGNKGYNGICRDGANEVCLSEVPKGEVSIALLYFNANEYSTHCKEYREYQTWLSERNTSRYVDTTKHGQKIDGKNLMHCRRLLDMAIEIAEQGIITVRRPNADYLLSIRRGEVSLEDIINQAEVDFKKLDSIYKKSSLPECCDRKIIDDLLINIRKM